MSENIDPTTAEKDVREKAAAFADAIETAKSIGYTVAFAGNVEGLRAVQISGTARVPAPPEPAPEAVPAEPAASRPAARTAPAGSTTTAETTKDAISGALKGQ